ncbi:MAG: Flp family type IVb pilin [Alphaproteobacteria bacterium]
MSFRLKDVKSLVLRYGSEEKAATAIEYGLIIAAIAIVILLTVFAIGGDIFGFFTEIDGHINPEL